MGQSIKPWIALTAFLAIIIAVAGWFLGVSPALTAASETRDSIEFEENRTIVLQSQLDLLKKQFDDLDTYREQLSDATVQVPSEADTADYRRFLASSADSAGITLLSISSGAAAAALVSTEPETTSETSDSTASATAEPSANESGSTAAPTTTTTSSGNTLIGIPFSVNTLGSYEGTRQFIEAMQGTSGRLFVVTNVGAVMQKDAPESAVRPETKSGDVEMTIEGFILVLQTPANSNEVVTEEPTDGAVDPSASPAPLPLPSTERNPFAPFTD